LLKKFTRFVSLKICKIAAAIPAMFFRGFISVCCGFGRWRLHAHCQMETAAAVISCAITAVSSARRNRVRNDNSASVVSQMGWNLRMRFPFVQRGSSAGRTMDYAIPLVATTALVFGAAAAVALIAMAALFTEELVVASAEVEAEGPAASPDRDRTGK
jgi:hypothetical protein